MFITLTNISWDCSSHQSGLTANCDNLPDKFVSSSSTVEGAKFEAFAVYGFEVQDCEHSSSEDPTYHFIVIDPASASITEQSAKIPKTGLWSHLGRLALGLPLGSPRGAPCNRWLGTAVIGGQEVDLMSFDETYFPKGRFKFVGEWKNENNSYKSGPIVILKSVGAGSTSLDKDVTASMVASAVRF